MKMTKKNNNPIIFLRTQLFVLMAITTLVSNELYANNITVSNVSLTGQNTTSGINNIANFSYIQFDLNWENSWRTSSGLSNWDAAWVFVKYRKSGTAVWSHATLNTTASNHTAPTGSTISQSDGTGIFIYRSTNGTGTFSLTDVELRWQYAADGLSDTNTVEISVQAIEMVYVPQAAFAAGSGGNEASKFTLTTINTGTATTVPSGTGAKGGEAGGYPTGQTAPSNASWPNGYNAFYCMKYETSQKQYVDFLNKLTRAQQNTRTSTSLASGTTSVTNRYVMCNGSNAGSLGSITMEYRNGIRCDATIHTSNPITFYCDFDGDGTGNESTDGQNIACSFLGWNDVAAYLDWSGLRPMTELEFEKACRGDQTPVANEYAWGSTSITRSTGISNSGLNNETTSTSGANTIYDAGTSLSNGPLRTGSFAGSNTTRAQAGATYYGIMDMSGNVWERTVTIGHADGRSFTGEHGNGAITIAGDANVSNWPGTNAQGIAFRGGVWSFGGDFLRVSDRGAGGHNGGNVDAVRRYYMSGRGVRTAP